MSWACIQTHACIIRQHPMWGSSNVKNKIHRLPLWVHQPVGFMWYDYDILPRAQQLPIISGSARTVVDYAAGLASPMHKGGGFIIAHHRLLLSGACERSVGRHFSRITPRLGTGPASAGSLRLRRTVCGVHTAAGEEVGSSRIHPGGAPLGSSTLDCSQRVLSDRTPDGMRRWVF